MRFLHFILSHSFFISLCAVSLCYQTYALLQIDPNTIVYAFVFFATLSSYNFYWLLSKFRFSKFISAADFISINFFNLLLVGIAGAGMFFCLYLLPSLITYALFAVVLTFLYSIPLWPPFRHVIILKKTGFLKPVLLAFTWSFVTTIIPASQVLSSSSAAVISLLTARFFFMFLLCIIFDRRDAIVDKINGLHSLATDVGKNMLKNLVLITFIIFIVSGLFIRYYFKDNAQLIAFFITGLMIWWVYRASLKKQGYVFYYFVVDGLMLFSAGATFIADLF